jgi:hypothetical protein
MFYSVYCLMYLNRRLLACVRVGTHPRCVVCFFGSVFFLFFRRVFFSHPCVCAVDTRTCSSVRVCVCVCVWPMCLRYGDNVVIHLEWNNPRCVRFGVHSRAILVFFSLFSSEFFLPFFAAWAGAGACVTGCVACVCVFACLASQHCVCARLMICTLLGAMNAHHDSFGGGATWH